ncbi:MAG: aminotransferase class V-fold PLP-dependent enzyme [Bacteroidota bacterium]
MPEFFPAATLQRAREIFPHTAKGQIYLNHAGTSPLSTRVLAVLSKYLHNRSEGAIDTYATDVQMVNECRSLVSRLINADSPDRIAFQTSTSDAINLVASGLEWKPGDQIILNTIEFPANVYPYLNLKRLGVEVSFLSADNGRITPEMIAGAVRPQTRLVALSAVQFLSGYRADLQSIGELCRSRGIVFAVDAIQAVGAVAIDVQRMKIDALAAGAQKWQMAPHGSGFLYVTEDLQSRIAQKYLGWLSVHDPWQFHDYDQPIAASARRYEGGSLNMPSLWGLHASLSTLLEFGTAGIERHILAITEILRDGLAEIPGIRVVTTYPDQERAGIITVALPNNLSGQDVFKRILSRGVTIALREGQLRYSPHFYCTAEDMAGAVQATKEALTS